MEKYTTNLLLVFRVHLQLANKILTQTIEVKRKKTFKKPAIL